MESASKIERLPIYVAIAATIVVIPSLMDPINLPKLWVLCFGGGLCFATFLNQITNLWYGRKKSLLYVTVGIASALLITSITSPQGVFRTLVGVWGRNNGALTYLALLIIFLSLASMRSMESSKFFLQSLTVLGFFGALYGWMQNVGADPISWENPGNKIILTLGNSNFASALLALASIATLTFVLRATNKPWLRIALSISFLVQMYLTMKSDALQGLLVLLIGNSILLGLVLTFSNRSVFKKFALVWWGVVSTLGALGIYGLFGNGPLSAFLNPNFRSLQDRFYHWVAALNMMRENLFFGVGIDSFGDYYRGFRVLEAIELRGTATSSTNNAHNTIMQIGATGGLVLLVAYLALIVFTARRAIIAFKKNDDKILVSGIFSIWVGFQVQSLVSIDQIGSVVWGWASAGCLVALSYVDVGPSKTNRNLRPHKAIKAPGVFNSKVVVSLLVIAGLAPSVLLIPVVQNDYQLRERIIELVSSSSEDALRVNAQKLYLEARKSDHPELRLQALSYLVQTKSKDISLDLAITTASQFPKSFESWDALARIYESQGKKEKALIARKMTVKLDPLNEEIKKLLESDMASD
jgi:O-antigen ligase